MKIGLKLLDIRTKKTFIKYFDIVAINYDCGMGYSIDYWHENDKVV